MFKILLYYKYINIDNPKKIRDEQFRVCKELDLKGRIIISSEGVNGTVSGETFYIEKYKEFMFNHPLFSDIEFKEDEYKDQVFPKLRVRVRKEIVTLNADDISIENKAKYISADEFHNLLESDEEYYIVDARNDYETRIGRFKNAITLGIKNFREFPKATQNLSNLKDKKIITYCTGGVRCEKASAYLVEQGFKNVYQLHGGIVKYGKNFPNGDFEGKCYVFDERIAVNVNSEENSKVISECIHCKNPSDRYINCLNPKCNLHFICCEECDSKHGNLCSENCRIEYTVRE